MQREIEGTVFGGRKPELKRTEAEIKISFRLDGLVVLLKGNINFLFLFISN